MFPLGNPNAATLEWVGGLNSLRFLFPGVRGHV